MGTVKGFGAFLASLVTRYGGTKQDLATRVGVSPSQFSRLLSADALPTIELCLNLADVTGLSVTVILRAANFTHVADQLERLFGAPVEQQACYPLTPRECTHIDQWRELETKERTALTVIIEAKIEATRRAPLVRPPRRAPATRSA
jgi:transcriptional regulator with XRE-family HTH domain